MYRSSKTDKKKKRDVYRKSFNRGGALVVFILLSIVFVRGDVYPFVDNTYPIATPNVPVTSTDLDNSFCSINNSLIYRNTTDWGCTDAGNVGGAGGGGSSTLWTHGTPNWLYNDSSALYFNETYYNESSYGNLVNLSGDTMTGQLVVKAGNGNIVSSNSAGGIDVQTSGGEAGSISFGNTADIGISRDGVVDGYDYDGAMIFKQKTSNPDDIGEFIWIEENSQWRFALPSSGPNYGTYNPRSMIVAGPSWDNGSNFNCSLWGFDQLDCNTGGTGADLGVQDDFQVLGQMYGNLNWSWIQNVGNIFDQWLNTTSDVTFNNLTLNGNYSQNNLTISANSTTINIDGGAKDICIGNCI